MNIGEATLHRSLPPEGGPTIEHTEFNPRQAMSMLAAELQRKSHERRLAEPTLHAMSSALAEEQRAHRWTPRVTDLDTLKRKTAEDKQRASKLVEQGL